MIIHFDNLDSNWDSCLSNNRCWFISLGSYIRSLGWNDIGIRNSSNLNLAVICIVSYKKSILTKSLFERKGEGRMNKYTAVTFVNLGVLTLAGFIFYLTNSWWALIILFCLFRTTKD